MGIRRISLLVMAVTLVVTAAAAQRGRQNVPRYDPASEVTVSGVVSNVDQAAGRRGQTGIHVTITTDAGPVVAHLGPAWFMDQNHFTVAAGDQLEIVGSKVLYSGAEVVIARTVTKGGSTVILRDERGIPKWSRQGAGRGPA